MNNQQGQEPNLQELVELAILAAGRACTEILQIYQSTDFATTVKSDQSPLTLADQQSHHVIDLALKPTGLPQLSEEGSSITYSERRHWDYFWLIDPLDGTKEFIHRNGDFTVNIALIHRGIPILGVVAIPVTGVVYAAAQGAGVVKILSDGTRTRLPKRVRADLKKDGLRVVASRSHLNEETQAFINQLTHPTLVSRGSSLKFLLLAEGEADVYPRFAPTMEWDTAAAHAIVRELSLPVWQQGKEEELVYNKENLLNPGFICY